MTTAAYWVLACIVSFGGGYAFRYLTTVTISRQDEDHITAMAALLDEAELKIQIQLIVEADQDEQIAEQAKVIDGHEIANMVLSETVARLERENRDGCHKAVIDSHYDILLRWLFKERTGNTGA